MQASLFVARHSRAGGNPETTQSVVDKPNIKHAWPYARRLNEKTNMSKNILILPGDGIGPEIVTEAVKVLNTVNELFDLNLTLTDGLVGFLHPVTFSLSAGPRRQESVIHFQLLGYALLTQPTV